MRSVAARPDALLDPARLHRNGAHHRQHRSDRVGSTIFSYFVMQTAIAQNAVTWIKGTGMAPILVMILVIVFYIFLSCFLEGIGMVLVTVPVFLPLVIANGYDPIWFGALLVIVVKSGSFIRPSG